MVTHPSSDGSIVLPIVSIIRWSLTHLQMAVLPIVSIIRWSLTHLQMAVLPVVSIIRWSLTHLQMAVLPVVSIIRWSLTHLQMAVLPIVSIITAAAKLRGALVIALTVGTRVGARAREVGCRQRRREKHSHGDM